MTPPPLLLVQIMASLVVGPEPGPVPANTFPVIVKSEELRMMALVPALIINKFPVRSIELSGDATFIMTPPVDSPNCEFEIANSCPNRRGIAALELVWNESPLVKLLFVMATPCT